MTMLLDIAQSVTFRALLPLSLLIAAFMRPSFISLSYVILALIAPLLPSPAKQLTSVTKVYLFTTFVIAFLAAAAQVSYQIYAASVFDANLVDFCDKSDYRYWMNQIGLIKIKTSSSFNVFRIVFPEIITFITSLITIIVCVGIRGNPTGHHHYASTSNIVLVRQSSVTQSTGREKLSEIANSVVLGLRRISDVSVLFMLLIAGIIQPSLLNAAYFIIFLFVMSWYSTYIPFSRRAHNRIKLIVITYAAIHFILIYLYQIPLFETFLLTDERFYERIIGFSPILTVKCTTWWDLRVNTAVPWTHIANAFSVIVFYYLVIAQYSWTQFGMTHQRSAFSSSSSVHEDRFTRTETECQGNSGRNPTGNSAGDNSLLNDVVEPAQHGQMEMQRISQPGLCRQQVSCIFRGIDGHETLTSQGLITVFTFVLYHSYIFALLAMMLWSLWYHSMFGLIFLVVACVLWVFKDTRYAAMKFSAFILVYGEVHMDIAGKLPEADIANWIGFIRAASREEAFVVLLIKCLLCFPLFILYRHHCRENFYANLNEHERARWIRHGTLYSAVTDPSGRAQQSLDESCGAQVVSLLIKILTKYWIFLVHGVILWISLQHPPLLYTIGYFGIFSLSILLFLISLELYRKILPIFWTLAIVYTSVFLICIYCYQFPGIPEKWKKLTGLSDDWNHDIGLINYGRDGRALFTRLLAPLLFFIVAMLQLKFFHRPWSQMVALPTIGSDAAQHRSG
uniref:Piezo-type mechanosensitive ion channel component n=1 Tax=Syphacia muris TaxID=451379 RepID=A0A0N5AVK8_9BILA